MAAPESVKQLQHMFLERPLLNFARCAQDGGQRLEIRTAGDVMHRHRVPEALHGRALGKT